MKTVGWKRICCPVDFSEDSDAVLNVAATLAARLDMELVILHVYEVPVLSVLKGSLRSSPDLLQELADRADAKLAEAAAVARAAGARRIQTTKIVGSPAQEFTQYVAQCEFDLVVMGTHAGGGMRQAFAGPVASRVVKSATCPVLVVPLRASKAEKLGLAGGPADGPTPPG